ncbi:MAG: hypothetical protein KatS3mg038_2081 [Candidatus Kapaibacterium sp.]|nr:MAG: hypothetical protein KatS3mg038_2081 [Candidatus Kapabacteria bacterium]
MRQAPVSEHYVSPYLRQNAQAPHPPWTVGTFLRRRIQGPGQDTRATTRPASSPASSICESARPGPPGPFRRWRTAWLPVD